MRVAGPILMCSPLKVNSRGSWPASLESILHVILDRARIRKPVILMGWFNSLSKKVGS